LSSSRWERFAPLTGVVFFILIAITFALSNDTPDTDTSTADTVSYWSAHDSRLIASSIIGTFAVIFFIWFAATLRSALLRAEGGDGRLSLLAFSGMLVIGISGSIGSALSFTVADSVNDVPPQVTQALSVLSEDFFLPFLAGIAVFMLATGFCVLRHGGLPRWLGWVAIALAVVSVTPIGFVGFLGAFVWVLVTSIVLYMRGPETPTAGVPPPPAPTT
jgi:hypothetical protein